MRGSRWIRAVIVLELSYALLMFGSSAYLLALTRTAAVRNAIGAADDIAGLKLAAGVVAGVAIFVLTAWFGMRKEKLWGWWLALIANAGTAGVLAYSMIDDGWSDLDWTMVALTTAFALLSALLFLPPVRRFY